MINRFGGEGKMCGQVNAYQEHERGKEEEPEVVRFAVCE